MVGIGYPEGAPYNTERKLNKGAEGSTERWGFDIQVRLSSLPFRYFDGFTQGVRRKCVCVCVCV